MATNNVDDILRGLYISTAPRQTPSTPSESVAPESTSVNDFLEQSTSFSEQDIDDILEDNGFSNTEEEEIDDTDTLERQSEEAPSEGNDALLDTLNEELDEHLEHSNPVETTIEDNTANEENTQEETPDSNLPLNSPTLLVNETTTRFSGAEWFKEIQKARIIIGGCGGIGSNLAFQLARMVPANITIYDDDNVEMVNMAGQLFSFNDLGKSKVDAMADMITSYTSMQQVNAIKAKFTSVTEPGDIMLCGFDNMEARKTFFNAWKEHLKGKTEEEKAKCLFMDGRLSLSILQILCIQGDDPYNINRYEEHFLFSDSEAEATVCSMKQTTYMACLIGSLMINIFTNFIANLLDPVIPYDLPFFTEYTAPNMLFKTES